MKDWIAKRAKYVYQSYRRSEFAFGVSISIVVGLTTGLGAVAFRWLIGFFQNIFFDGGAKAFSFMGHYYVILLPAIGGVLIWLLIRYTNSTEAKGHGVPEVMAAVATRGGRIRARIAMVKTLASSICIGSGGSVGREGPIVQIGSTIGSILGQWLGLSTEWVKTLVACGAAGGISATFNAPLAGIFFAHEVILGRIFTRHFGFVVIASVLSDAVAHALLGDLQSFTVPIYTLHTNWELALYFLLGVGCAGVAVLFTWVLYKFEDLFQKIKIPGYIKPVIGGLGVGVIGLYFPYIFGVGYEGVEQALSSNLVLTSLAAMLVLKILATSLTLGSGGSGGVFAPSLFIGSMFGGVFGDLMNRVFPGHIAPSGAYALVGMAAVFSGAARAPITAIIIVFEMTRNYAIILPVMIAVVISTFIANRLNRESIYTIKLKNKGIDIHSREEIDVLENISVSDIMTQSFPVVSPDLSILKLADKFAHSRYHSFPVVDEIGNFRGMVSMSDLEANLSSQNQSETVKDIATTTNLITAYPDESLHEVMHRLGDRDLARIPVVDRQNQFRIIGILRRNDIISAYTRAIKRTEVI
jgi:CIC family chloride channel protein